MELMIPQYYTAKRMISYVGVDGIAPESFDYDPATVFPSHGPDEFANMPIAMVIANKSSTTRRRTAGFLRRCESAHRAAYAPRHHRNRRSN